MKISSSLKKYNDFLSLAKITVILPVAFTSFTGYFLVKQELDQTLLVVSLGVMFLAAAASSLNQIQEKDIDFKMSRTRNRPIPGGRISVNSALIFSIVCFITGTFLLYLTHSLPAMLLGFFSLIWYNLIYTPLKKITAFAIIPGSLTGAIPPVIGWLSAGGFIFDKTLILLAFLMFIFQIPHFWLLLLIHGKDYEAAGIPSLTKIFNLRQISHLSYIWVVAAIVSALLLSTFGMLYSPVLKYLSISISFFSIIVISIIMKKDAIQNAKKCFIILNSYIFIILLILIIDKI